MRRNDIAEMRRTGVRRICLLAGDDRFLMQAVYQWQQGRPGDWTGVSDRPWPGLRRNSPAAFRNLLGQEFQHGIFDARQGWHAEALAALSGTLMAGSWLLILLPAKSQWLNRPDHDSLRWADVSQPLSTPVFAQHLLTLIQQDPELVCWCQGQPCPEITFLSRADWHCNALNRQQQLLEHLAGNPAGIAVLTAPRGRGKSALAGMLAARQPPCLITAPAKTSTATAEQFAGDHYQFMAPDTLLAADPQTLIAFRWLIIDEAAALPANILEALIHRMPATLLITTVQGYEGTGQGFLLKFCAKLTGVRYYQLDQPLRWSEDDPLERFISQLFLMEQEPLPADMITSEPVLSPLITNLWAQDPDLAASVYRLLLQAHYRTTPLDLRRMMDAPGMQFSVLVSGKHCLAALWLVGEGGLSESLSWQIWCGSRRPRGNLVAQSLAAHSAFPEAARLRSLRISRIAIEAGYRRQGWGKALVSHLIDKAGDYDFLSVSFGWTPELWSFWEHCGFQLVRIGTYKEASSGCYAAMAIYPVSIAGQQLCQQAATHFSRDWYWQQSQWCTELPLTAGYNAGQQLSDSDWQEVAGFAWAHRPLPVSYPALQRCWQEVRSADRYPLLQALLEQADLTAKSGHKAWLRQLRVEAAALLETMQPAMAKRLKCRIQSL